MAPNTCRLLLAAFALSTLLATAHAAEPTEGPAVVTSPAAAAPPQATAAEEPSSTEASRQTNRNTRTDRLELDTTVVTGNRELPKVLYIVPWKKADLGDLPGQPFNTLLDEVLMPVDRDVFRREVTYFETVTESADATQSTSRPQE